MNDVVSMQMKRAIVRARKRLRQSTSNELNSYGLNRYRIAQKKQPLVIVVNRQKGRKPVH